MYDIVSYLFKTNAIRFCEENNPFWYTSGKIGPYFINTHFLYGSKESAEEQLAYIDDCLSDKLTLPNKIFKNVIKQYEKNSIYKDVINHMVSFIKEHIEISKIDYISGGERRDWFFSNIIAYLLNKPHISIYKDLSAVVSDSKFENTKIIENIEGKNVLHIADLITIASSYTRAWIPAIESIGGKILWSLTVIDRMQGGKEKLEQSRIKSFSLVNVDTNLFQKAFELNIINESQLKMLNGFFADPDKTMREFLINHPEFLEKALNSDEKTKKRAQLLVDSNLYNLT